MTQDIRLVDVSEIEKLQKYGLCNQGFYDVCVDRKTNGKYVKLDDLRALLSRSPQQSSEAVAYRYRYHDKADWTASTSFWNTNDVEWVKSQYPKFELEPLFTHAPNSVPVGWKLAPIEPTDLMLLRAHEVEVMSIPPSFITDKDRVTAVYKAMLSAYKGNE